MQNKGTPTWFIMETGEQVAVLEGYIDKYSVNQYLKGTECEIIGQEIEWNGQWYKILDLLVEVHIKRFSYYPDSRKQEEADSLPVYAPTEFRFFPH